MSRVSPKIGWLVLILILGGCLIFARFWWRISNVICWLDNQPCPPAELARFSSLAHKSMLFFDQTKLMADVTAHSEYHLEKIRFEVPHTLVIYLTTQSPAYVLTTDTQDEALVISNTGQRIANNQTLSLTKVFVPVDAWAIVKGQGSVTAAFHQQLLEMLATLATNAQLPPYLTWVDAQTVVLDTPGQAQIIVDPSNLRTNLARLKVTQQALEATGSGQLATTPVAEIDVRFQLPVLRETLSIPRHLSQ